MVLINFIYTQVSVFKMILINFTIVLIIKLKEHHNNRCYYFLVIILFL